MILLYIFVSLIFLIFVILWKKTHEVNIGRKKAELAFENTLIFEMLNITETDSLEITPIIDSETDRKILKTEHGVSVYIQTSKNNILMDIGLNKQKTHPSPFLQNIDTLKIDLDRLDAIVFSHAHLDHLGGIKEQKTKTFSFSQGKTTSKAVPVFAPENIKPSFHNPQFSDIYITKEPTQLFEGVYTIGTIPRHLFLMGYVEEQALAFNLKDKGIVLLVGCGHQTIQRILKRTRQLFDLPIYAVLGGLHYPIFVDEKKSPFSIAQYVVGNDYAPWVKGLKKQDVFLAIEALQAENVTYVGLSPHDSSQWSINQFKNAFGENYIDYKVGKTIIL